MQRPKILFSNESILRNYRNIEYRVSSFFFFNAASKGKQTRFSAELKMGQAYLHILLTGTLDILLQSDAAFNLQST